MANVHRIFALCETDEKKALALLPVN